VGKSCRVNIQQKGVAAMILREIKEPLEKGLVTFGELDLGDTFITSKGSQTVYMKMVDSWNEDAWIVNAVSLGSGLTNSFTKDHIIIPVEVNGDWRVLE
jgi:hypothetical protein